MNKHGGWNRGLTRVDWDSRVREVLGGRFELISRVITENGETKLLIKCTSCGEEKEISSISLRGRHSKKVSCKNCSHIETVKRNELEKHRREEKRRLIKLEQLRSREQISFPLCECGELLPIGRKTCDRCQRHKRRLQERRKEHRRRNRTKEFDETITLEKLYKRDNGVCYLCNKECDWTDFQKVNGAFVVGGSYPTVEHIVPLCKGGLHKWDNVKLACHACNSRKGTKLLPPF